MVIPRPGSELKAVEEACREASRTVERLNGLNLLNGPRFYTEDAFYAILARRIKMLRGSDPAQRIPIPVLLMRMFRH